MAFSTGRMSTMPPTEQPLLPLAVSPARASHHPGRAGSDEENLAVSLMMLSRGVRDEPLAHFADVAAPAQAPHVADVPAGEAYGLAQEPVVLLSQASAAPVVAASQTLASVAVVTPSQTPAPPRQVPSPVVAVGPSLVLEQAAAPSQAPGGLVIVPGQAPAPVFASTQAQDPMVVVAPNKASKPVTAPRKASTPAARPERAPKITVAAQSRAPEQEKAESSQLLHECPVCKKMFNTSRGLNMHMKCHPDGRLHPCEFCMSTFPSTSALRSHVRRSETCGGDNRRRLGPVAAAAIAWHIIDLNMPEI